ncbi:asparagine synthase related protein [Xylona heveae TC161]|uniref:Asparagine synthase related protein n=1 Tax=Xylona heveae (strain CBS 132557 / TC161) TaxID=1328760 RepID=A0A165JMV3_XYLHT|nr:asparagine synthase related protein [Xylona heveae TC161]KZF26434.1 asparagine synthase related protein [Xylona heveae TC161]
MCGIHFSIGRHAYCPPDDNVAQLLVNRGPDSIKTHNIKVNVDRCTDSSTECYLSFTSTVLALRGDHVTVQPLVDTKTGSVLCWNGEAWKIEETISGNDAEAVFQLLLHASSQDFQFQKSANGGANSPSLASPGIVNAINSISGPFAFVFFDATNQRIFFSRDCLGRRSLLSKADQNHSFTVSSICNGSLDKTWLEVEADGVYVVSLKDFLKSIAEDQTNPENPFGISKVPWVYQDGTADASHLKLPYPKLNKELPSQNLPVLNLSSPSVQSIEKHLLNSLRLRVQNVPTPPVVESPEHSSSSAKVAILFSGGLDCTMLARLSHEVLPFSEDIDLLNVAFENPRVVAAARKEKRLHNETDGTSTSCSAYDLCPDRLTARASHKELEKVCPQRKWHLVEINVPYQEMLEHRPLVISLIHPHNTEMDLSIANAFYFAARGIGTVQAKSYITPARILLSGLGADELFGGYGRHRVAFNRDGFPGLLDELELDVNRLGKRNLGRDDRVIAHWGKEARFPFLDEQFLNWSLGCPVWEKCGFGQPENAPDADDARPELILDAEKKVLRLLAWKSGMHGVAKEKKRAIQFGARTAKMEVGRTKGTQLLS